MIALSDEAVDVLYSRNQARMWVDVKLYNTAGTLVIRAGKDLVALDQGGLGAIRRSVRPLSREFEVGIGGVSLDNSPGWKRINVGGDMQTLPFQGDYSWRDAYSETYTEKLIGGAVEIDLMVPIPDAATEPYRIFTGVLGAISLTNDGGASLKVIDAHEKLRQSSTGDKAGTVMIDNSPAGLILTLLGTGYAGLDAAWYDAAGLAAAAIQERLDRRILRGYEITSGSWLANVNAILQHTNAVIAIDRYGKLSYYRLWPEQPGGGDASVTEGDGVLSASLTMDLAPVKNAASVLRWNGTTTVATEDSPLSDADSVTDYGERWDRVRSFRYFDEDATANLTAGQDVFYQSQPIEVLEMACDIRLMALDVFDTIMVYLERLALTGTMFRVFETTLDLSRQQVSILGMNTVRENQPWLETDAGHYLTGSRVVF